MSTAQAQEPARTLNAGQSGAYLALRQADFARDFSAVAQYGPDALAQQAGHPDVLETLVVAHESLGDMAQAIVYARQLADVAPDNQLAKLVLLADELQQQNWAEARSLLDENASISDLVKTMASAWISLGQGKMSVALDVFDEQAKDDTRREFALYNKSLALALVGDFEGAAHILSGKEGPILLNRHSFIAYAQVLSQLDRHKEALALLTNNAAVRSNPEAKELITRLQADEAIPFDAIRSANDAIAQLFQAVAESHGASADPVIPLLFSRMSQHLNPDEAATILMSASFLEQLELHDEAAQTYAQVPENSPLYLSAALGRTTVLRSSNQLEAATDELAKLAQSYPENLRFRVALGDVLMQQNRFEDARQAYDQAIDGFSQDLEAQWATYFQRAIALTKLGDWPSAEADFKKALSLSPEHPNVLNYLGYSYLENGTHLEEALDMIDRAAAARPNSGFIVDSLGWGLFRTGKYEEAVVEMERAVELLASDPILNDHLGDTYWAVGRKREAEFQWKRALSFISEDTDLNELNPDRIRKKIKVGLDVVLQEEDAAPLTNQP
jgi:tetratricopeptide (TPR) repeat protein